MVLFVSWTIVAYFVLFIVGNVGACLGFDSFVYRFFMFCSLKYRLNHSRLVWNFHILLFSLSHFYASMSFSLCRSFSRWLISQFIFTSAVLAIDKISTLQCTTELNINYVLENVSHHTLYVSLPKNFRIFCIPSCTRTNKPRKHKRTPTYIYCTVNSFHSIYFKLQAFVKDPVRILNIWLHLCLWLSITFSLSMTCRKILWICLKDFCMLQFLTFLMVTI